MVRLVLILWLFAVPTFAQETLSVFKLSSNYGQGSAVVVHRYEDNTDAQGNPLGLAATAYHVLTDQYDRIITNSAFKAEYLDGTKSEGLSYALGDRQNDIALVWLIVPAHVKAVPIVDTKEVLPEIKEDFEPQGLMARFMGFGRGQWKETRGRTSFRSKGQIQSDAILYPGQSGGAMFIDDKLAGIICGGNSWYGDQGKVTWPARCADASLIPPMIERAHAIIKAHPYPLR